jgi:hypothetical protein
LGYSFKIERLDTFMQRLTARNIQIDSVHCNAVSEEIGHRLSQFLKTETSDLPPQLKLLLNRLRQQDREEAPSIVPSLDDMELRRMHRALSV